MLEATARVQRELDDLRSAHPEGSLFPREVHEWARTNPNSAIHEELEWDDKKAGYAHRLSQIRRLISIHVVDAKGERIMVSLSIDRPKGGGYRSLDHVLPNMNLRRVMVADALKELQTVRHKYNHLSELAAVWEAAETARMDQAREEQEPKGARKRPAVRKRASSAKRKAVAKKGTRGRQKNGRSY